ncbi:4578_t:CDS:2, partial [Entrophospora sp. SA101]
MNIFSSNCVRTHEKPKPFVETFGEDHKFCNEDKKKYQLLDNALEEVYLKLTNEERNKKDDNDNVIKNPLK